MNGRLHWSLFLLAFAAAVLIKFNVYETEQPAEKVIDAQVTYNPPADDVISYDLVNTVQVRLRGRSSGVLQLSVLNVAVVVDVPAGRTGATEITLGEDNVRIDVPGSFEVLSIKPTRLVIKVERRAVDTVPIVVELVGEPAAGAIQGEPIVTPARGRISGPESKVRQITELTARVSLDGRGLTFSETVPVASPDPLVQVTHPTQVVVEVPMQEPELTLDYEDLLQEPQKQ